MTLRIGWYVHHHGRGHLARLLAIAPHLDAQIHGFSSLPAPDPLPAHLSWTVLDADDVIPASGADPAESDPTAGGALHWAPLGHAGHQARLTAIAAAVTQHRFDAFVVDVSVEVTALVRLLGVRTIVIAQPGLRDDAAHRLGYSLATTIIAPWPRALLEPAHLDAVRDRMVYTGGISRFEGRGGPGSPVRGTDVVLLGGQGGSDVTSDDIEKAALSSGHPWRLLGATPAAGWAADPWLDLRSARVVVAWAGQNSIADLAAADAPAVIIPQARPFDEQRQTALAVAHAGLAVVATRWPEAQAWPELISRAAALPRDWSRWQVAGAAGRAADAIAKTASG